METNGEIPFHILDIKKKKRLQITTLFELETWKRKNYGKVKRCFMVSIKKVMWAAEIYNERRSTQTKSFIYLHWAHAASVCWYRCFFQSLGIFISVMSLAAKKTVIRQLVKL